MMSVEECALRGRGELCVPRCKRHHSRRRVYGLGGVHVILYGARLRRDGLEYWIDAITRVGRRKSLVLWNDALVRCRIEVMRGHEVGRTMLPTASACPAQSELRSCTSTLAVLLLTWVVLLLVRYERLIVLRQCFVGGLDG